MRVKQHTFGVERMDYDGRATRASLRTTVATASIEKSIFKSSFHAVQRDGVSRCLFDVGID